jgi:hypothetical protein
VTAGGRASPDHTGRIREDVLDVKDRNYRCCSGNGMRRHVVGTDPGNTEADLHADKPA